MSDGSIRHVTIHEVPALLDDGALLIDVRERHEISMGHIPSATCMPMQSFNVDRLPVDLPLVFICRSGNRSDALATALAAMGYTTYNVLGGMAAWQAAGWPVVADNGGPGTVL